MLIGPQLKKYKNILWPLHTFVKVIWNPSIFDFMTIEQLVETVTNTDTDINASISTKAALNYTVAGIFLYSDDSKVIILFTRVNTS